MKRKDAICIMRLYIAYQLSQAMQSDILPVLLLLLLRRFLLLLFLFLSSMYVHSRGTWHLNGVGLATLTAYTDEYAIRYGR